jgi:hypothetical protein
VRFIESSPAGFLEIDRKISRKGFTVRHASGIGIPSLEL